METVLTLNKIDNQKIALISTQQARYFIKMLQKVETNIYPILEEVGLPDRVLNTHHPYIPEIPIRLLLEKIVSKCGLDSYYNICWLACREVFIPHLLDKISDADNLQSLLQKFIKLLKNDSTQVQLSLQINKQESYLVRNKPYSEQPWYLYAELFSVAYMIELIRAVCGKEWLPEEVYVQSNEQKSFIALLHSDNKNLTPTIHQRSANCSIKLSKTLLLHPYTKNKTSSKSSHAIIAPQDF